MRRKNLKGYHMFFLTLVIGLTLIGLKIAFFSASSNAETTVEKFYSLEKTSNYSGSWELFHPYMKKRFPKLSFIQDRSHVFIGHFGAEAFTYKISKAEKIENWRPEKDEPSIKIAYRFNVTQSYKGKYGKFSFVQEVYAVQYKGEWTILLDYNE